jgi:hypothetical protein
MGQHALRRNCGITLPYMRCVMCHSKFGADVGYGSIAPEPSRRQRSPMSAVSYKELYRNDRSRWARKRLMHCNKVEAVLKFVARRAARRAAPWPPARENRCCKFPIGAICQLSACQIIAFTWR